MKQKLSILLITSTLVCSLCAGCNNNSSQTKVTQINEPDSISAEELKDDTKDKFTNDNQNNEQQNTSSTSTSESESFVFRPIVDSPFYENAYSKEHMQTFRNMMNALMEYKTEFVIEEGVEWWEVEEFTPYMFPAYEYVVKQIDQNGLTGNIVYKNDKESTETLIREFAEKVEWWINSCTKPEEPDVLKALELYHKLSLEFTYDYDVYNSITQGEFFEEDISPYHAIMESTGVCQSIAPAYSYLLMQVGIDACPAGGLLNDNSAAHVWTALKLYDKWFFADITYENTDGSEGKRLYYFGETTEKRANEDNYSIDTMNIGECNCVWAKDFDFSDERFFVLDNISEVKEMTYDSDNVIIEGLDYSCDPITVKIPLE